VVKNKVQLITYPDSMGGNLKILYDVLESQFPDVFQGGIHILPPFPSSGDRGFAPLTYLEIEPAFGSWADIRRLGKKYDILLDLMVNHISAKSHYFLDFLDKGRESEFADLFMPAEKVWSNTDPSKEEIEKIFLRRDEPFSYFTIKNTGEVKKIWTTFGKTEPSEQIDLDIHSTDTRKLLFDFLKNFSENQVKIVRLDAIGYVIKKPGTSCFFVEPEIYEFLEWISNTAQVLDIELLPEVHAHYSTQYKLAEHGYWIYDFILPYLVLDTMIKRSNKKLYTYLRDRPEKQFTMLDCHDGVPVKPDLNDLYESSEARNLVDTCLERGGNLSLIYSPKHKDKDGFDVHQIRGTYYSLLDCNDDAYLAARAIQFFTPGVPQIYYVGLLAGENDTEAYKAEGDGRVINRHNYSVGEIEQQARKDVVKRLVRLTRFRNSYPAFDGEFKTDEEEEDKIHLTWKKDKKICELKIDLTNFKTSIDYIDKDKEARHYIV